MNNTTRIQGLVDVELDWPTNTLSLRLGPALVSLQPEETELLIARLQNGLSAQKRTAEVRAEWSSL